MNILKKFKELFSSKHLNAAPILIIKKDSPEMDIKEYRSIDEAISDLENDLNVPREKIEKLKSSLRKLKNRNSIKIRNGEIIK